MFRKISLVVALITMVLLVGCATIFSGTTQTVTINADPADAMVTIQTLAGIGITSGKAPLAADLARGSAYRVVVSMEGYEDGEIIINKGFNVVALGNLICGGLPGGVIDAITGALYELTPDQALVRLEKSTSGSAPGEMMIALYLPDSNGDHVRYEVPMVKSL